MSDNTKLFKPSVALLPMADIAETLNKKYNFITDQNTATDTKTVGGIDANTIAQAIDKDHRNIVEYATKISNVDKTTVFTIDDLLVKDNKDFKNISTLYSVLKRLYDSDVKNIRDELYDLKAQLIKNHSVSDYNNINGFLEAFNNKRKKYIYSKDYNKSLIYETPENLKFAQIAGKSIDGHELYVNDKDNFSIGDWIVIVDSSEFNKINFDVSYYDKLFISATVVGITDLGILVEAEKDLNTINNISACYIIKTCGSYYMNEFFNGFIKEDGTTNIKRYTSLLDDTNTTALFQDIKSKKSGIAFSFKMPLENTGTIESFRIRAISSGNPGYLCCSIIKESDMKNFINSGSAINNKLIIGKSEIIPVDTKLNLIERDIVFSNFTQFDNNEPVLLENERYCFIVYTNEADTFNNYWRIKSITSNTNNDLQTNNVIYKFTDIEDKDIGNIAPFTVIQGCDMYHELITNKTRCVVKKPLTKGLYSAHYVTPKHIKASKVRVSLRINKEGSFKYNNFYPVSIKAGEKLSPNNKFNNNFIVSKNDIIISGQDFIKDFYIDNNTNIAIDNITINEDMLIDVNEFVYRMGYQVQCKIKYADNKFKILPLKLKYIIKDGLDKSTSDKLILETEILENDSLSRISDFEIQIKWKTPYKITDVQNEDFNLIGAISDINFIVEDALCKESEI